MACLDEITANPPKGEGEADAAFHNQVQQLIQVMLPALP